jgi:hypothetical protein
MSTESYDVLARQFQGAPPGKLFMLRGSGSTVFRLSLHLASHALLQGIPIALVDGSNRFDAYSIADVARQVTSRRLLRRPVRPEDLLRNIFVARAFTCYQMEATVTERLPAFVQRIKAPVAIIFGLLDTFYDEQAPFFEVKAGLERIITALQRLKQENVSVLLASTDIRPASQERNGLMPRVEKDMDRVYRVGEGEIDGKSNEPQRRRAAEDEPYYRNSDRMLY